MKSLKFEQFVANDTDVHKDIRYREMMSDPSSYHPCSIVKSLLAKQQPEKDSTNVMATAVDTTLVFQELHINH